MIRNFAKKRADSLIEKGADPENREILVYGIECSINEIIANIIMFAFAFAIGRPLEMLIWNVFMLPVRVSLGGHHAKTHSMCLAYSTALAVVCIIIYPFLLNLSGLVYIEIAITLTVAFTIAPYIHRNHPVSDTHRDKLRKWGRIISVIESGIIIFLLVFATPWMAQVAGLGMVTASVLCIIGKCQDLFSH